MCLSAIDRFSFHRDTLHCSPRPRFVPHGTSNAHHQSASVGRSVGLGWNTTDRVCWAGCFCVIFAICHSAFFCQPASHQTCSSVSSVCLLATYGFTCGAVATNGWTTPRIEDGTDGVLWKTLLKRYLLRRRRRCSRDRDGWNI